MILDRPQLPRRFARGPAALALAVCLAMAGPAACRAAGNLFDPTTNLIFEHITVDNGLPENSVRAILQDRTGFLWFGTQNGLVRYDGVDMTVYSPVAGDSSAFGGRTVDALLEDRDGVIWIGTFLRGLWRLDPERGDFAPVTLLADHNGDSTLHVRDISEDADRRLWIGTQRGLASRDRDGTVRWHETVKPADGSAAPPDIICTMSDRQGRVWCGTEGQGVLVYRPATGGVTQFRHDAVRANSLANDVVRDIIEDAQGRIWLATDHGLCLWQEGDAGFVSYLPAPGSRTYEENLCVRIAPDQQGLLWIGSAAGLYVFDPVLAQFRLFAHRRDNPHSLVNGPILSLLIDRSGLLWAGSWHTGLNKANPAGGWFHTQEFSAPDLRLDVMAVDAIRESRDGTLWVGASEYPRGRGHGRLFRRASGDGTFAAVPVAPDASAPPQGILSLLDDPDGSLWVGSQAGLWYLAAGRLAPFAGGGADAIARTLSRASVKAMGRDREGRLWLGTGAGVFRWDAAKNELRRFVHEPARANSLSANDAVSLLVDASGRVWIGTDLNGLNLFLSDDEGFRRFENPDRGLETVSDIRETAAGEMWLATFSGLVRFDRSSGGTEVLDRSSGLPNDEVASLLETDDGYLWISTGYGLARVDPRTKKVFKYDVRDGLPDNEVRFAACRGRDGQLYFGGARGLISFRPELFNRSNTVPPVVLTGLAVSDEPLSPKAGGYLETMPDRARKLELPYGANDVAFRFAALDFGRPDRNQYRFRLEGVDDEWRVPRGEPVASYTNLRPGQYLFRVQGSNRDGVWNEDGASLALRILPPWWGTTWALLLYGLAALLLAFGVYRQLTARHRLQIKLEVQRAESAKLQELDEMKSRFLTNITHEFRTPLTLIKAPLQRLRLEAQDPQDERYEIMMRNAGRLEQLIDQLLDLARLEAGRLPLRWQYGDCVAFLRLFATSLRSLPAQRHITYEVTASTDSAHGWHDQDLLEKVVGNLVVNAVKHTPDGGAVRFDATVGAARPVPSPRGAGSEGAPIMARTLTITVSNSGSYIPEPEMARIFDRFHQATSSEGFGVGLALVRELTDLLGGSVAVASDQAQGTTFTVTLPLYADSPTGAQTPPAAAPGNEAAAPRGPAGAVEDEVDEGAEGDSDEPCVLIVEDQADLLEFMAGDLKDRYRVLTAMDGRAGLKLAIDEIPDLVLSDVMMPEMSGFELCDALKQDERTSHIPVILLTARADAESRHEGLRLGADDYLGKPFDLEDLRLRIHNLIEQRRRMAESYQRRLAMLAPDQMPVTSADERFVLQLRQAIDGRLDDEEFRITELCREVGMSRSQLHRKLRAVTGKSASEFVRSHRLQRAAQLFDGGYGNVTEVAYAVGFHNLSYFSRSFRDLYGVQPSEYLKDRKGRAGSA